MHFEVRLFVIVIAIVVILIVARLVRMRRPRRYFLDDEVQQSDEACRVSRDYIVSETFGSPDQPLSRVCNVPEGHVVVGIEGFHGCIFDNFRLISRSLNANGTLGDEMATSCFSSNGDRIYFSNVFEDDKVLVGVHATFMPYESSSAPTLVNLEYRSDDLCGNRTEYTSGTLNSAGCYTYGAETSYEFMCPRGYAIVGFSCAETEYTTGFALHYARVSCC